MGGKNTNQLEFTLNNRGESLSYILTVLPLALYVYVYGVSRTFLIVMIFMIAAAAFLSIYRPQRELSGNAETAAVIGSYHLIYSVTLLMFLPAGTPLVFLGVMFSGLSYYSFGRIGILVSSFLNIGTVITQYLMLGSDVTIEQLTALIATTAMMVLLTYFVYEVIEVAQQQLDKANSANKNIKLEHQRLVSLINNIGDAVIATDENGCIQTYNGAALELLDTNKSLTGAALKDTWHLLDEQNQTVDLIDDVNKAGRNIRRSDLRIAYKADDVAKLYINITPIKLGYGATEQQGFTLIMRDITKEKSLDEERDEFISVVSHELRTPITITEGKISNAQYLLEKPEVDKDSVVTALKVAHDQVVFLSNMINDLSTLSRAERDDIELDLEPIDPYTMLEELAKSYEIEAQQHGLELLIDRPRHHIKRVYTNRLYLQEVLQNFVTNAIKYTHEGSIRLSVASAGDKVNFSITDTGIGISKSDQKHLFDKFFRSEDYRTRESSGTGLGLYVTKKLADKIRAKITVESQLNEGSTFTIEVPSLSETKTKRRDEPSAAGA